MSTVSGSLQRVPVFLFGWPGRGSFNASAAAAIDRLCAPLAAEGIAIDPCWRQAFDVPERIAAIEEVLASGPPLVVVHGGQGDAPVARLALLHPDVRFAVTPGSVTGANVASYEVRQEESAFLAGVLAARATRTGIVAHLSGERVRPGLLGRAAFVAGVQAEAPGMPVLTAFCGHQHDPALAHRWAGAMFDAGTDILFTMLDGGRPGAIDACRERGTTLIGNVEDWTLREPEVCIASAIADSVLAEGLRSRILRSTGFHRRGGASCGEAATPSERLSRDRLQLRRGGGGGSVTGADGPGADVGGVLGFCGSRSVSRIRHV